MKVDANVSVRVPNTRRANISGTLPGRHLTAEQENLTTNVQVPKKRVPCDVLRVHFILHTLVREVVSLASATCRQDDVRYRPLAASLSRVRQAAMDGPIVINDESTSAAGRRFDLIQFQSISGMMAAVGEKMTS